MPPKIVVIRQEKYADSSTGLCGRKKTSLNMQKCVNSQLFRVTCVVHRKLCQRGIINDMLREWDKAHPKRLHSIFGALQNVSPSQLADRELFDFEALDSQRVFDFADQAETKRSRAKQTHQYGQFRLRCRLSDNSLSIPLKCNQHQARAWCFFMNLIYLRKSSFRLKIQKLNVPYKIS